MNRNKIFAGFLAGLAIIAMTVPACKRYVDPPPYFETPGDTTKPVSRKILIIGIDGAVGSEYKTMALPVLEGLKAHSKYSWDAISDASTTDAASWKTLVTGLSYSTHQIKDSTFIYTQPAGGNQHSSMANYPNFFSYILSSAQSDLKTSFISTWGEMLNRLVPEVEDKVLATSDIAVKDSAMVRVKDPGSDLVVVHFNSVAKAGIANSFSAADAGYKDAALEVDGYVGELMAALKSRPEYNKSEEWLVIIQGTHGGNGNSYGGVTEKEINVFSFFYNENIKNAEMVKPAFTGVQLKERDAKTIKAQINDDGGLYNAGTGQQTIQLKIKGNDPGRWPHFFTRMESWPGTPGWSWFASGTNWAFSVRSTTGSERRIESPTPPVFDGQWHTLTVVIYDSVVGTENKRWVKRFTDGNRVIENSTGDSRRDLGTNYGSIETTSPMFLGWGGDRGMGAVNFSVADVMIFNTALTDDEVKNNTCLADATQHPKYTNLNGYWPFNDGGFTNIVKNKAAGNRPDFTLSGVFSWNGTDVPCTTAPLPAGTTPLLIKSVDIVTTALYWLKIPVATTWNLEGSKWLEQYESEFVKL